MHQNHDKTIIWLKHAANFGVVSAINIESECKVKDIKSGSNDDVFECIRIKMLSIKKYVIFTEIAHYYDDYSEL